MTNTESNQFKLAKKLYALSKQGVGGEKDNAAEMLEKLCKKHNISMEDLEDEVKREREFSIKKDEYIKRLFFQVVFSVVDRDRDVLTYTNSKSERKKGYKSYFINLTDYEFLEITSKYEFYLDKYTQDADIFFSAFIQRNRLFPKTRASNDEELSEEEQERIMKVLSMASNLDKHEFLKRIENH